MTTLLEKIAVMQAHADGKKIQYCNPYNGHWISADSPSWDWSKLDYRVAKPKPDSFHWPDLDKKFRYIARDKTYGVWAYEERPHLLENCWNKSRGDAVRISGVFTSHKQGDVDWNESLIERPDVCK